MEGRHFDCGCYQLVGKTGETMHDVYCTAHGVQGRALQLMVDLAGARELWEALEASAAADVRERGHTFYYRVERAIGELKAILDLNRDRSAP